jgi:predicted permease
VDINWAGDGQPASFVSSEGSGSFGYRGGRVATILYDDRVREVTYNDEGNVEGFERGQDVDANSRFNMVAPTYFTTLDVPVLSGREFATSDATGTPRVAIVNEAFATKFGLGREAVGRRMGMSGSGDELDIEIVGLVRDAKYNEVKGEVPPVFFLPWRQDQDGRVGSMTFYVRSSIDPAQVLRSVPQVVAKLDPNLPVESLMTLPQQVRENVFLDRMISTLSAVFAALATLLAGVGLYGVLAYTVARRTREIGVRMALGADRRYIRAMVLRQVGIMLAIGGVIGIATALLLGRYASALLYDVSATDPVVVIGAVALLTVFALLAGFLPAHRASRVDPMQALRYE